VVAADGLTGRVQGAITNADAFLLRFDEGTPVVTLADQVEGYAPSVTSGLGPLEPSAGPITLTLYALVGGYGRRVTGRVDEADRPEAFGGGVGLSDPPIRPGRQRYLRQSPCQPDSEGSRLDVAPWCSEPTMAVTSTGRAGMLSIDTFLPP